MALTRERFEQLIARSSDSVVGTDRGGTVVYYNDGAKRILGYEPDEILRTPVVRLYPDLDEARRVMAAMRDPGYGGAGIVESSSARPLVQRQHLISEYPRGPSASGLSQDDSSDRNLLSLGSSVPTIRLSAGHRDSPPQSHASESRATRQSQSRPDGEKAV